MKMFSFVIALLAFIVSPFSGLSQISESEVKNIISESSEKELVMQSSSLLQENYFHYADLVTDALLKINPESSNYKYRKGFIELTMRQNYLKAIELFLSAIGSTDKNYDMYSVKESSVPVDIYYHLGKAHHLNEDFPQAIKNYNLFLSKTRKESELIEYAEKGVEQCVIAKKLMAEPKEIMIENLGDIINTEYADFSSNISLDGKSLYFTSRRPWADDASGRYKDPMFNHYTEDIYQSSLVDNGVWNSPSRMNMCKPQFNEASVSVSIDERRVYTYNDKEGRGNVYFSSLKNGRFSPITPVDKKGVNTETRWETHYTVSPDGSMVFFVSDKEGGYGRRDIYFMEEKDGTWSEPKNIGGTINSSWDEDSPFMGLDNNVLYFSSNNTKSMGDFDVFMSVRDENGIWSAPVNLGSPVNSVGDDLFYTQTADGSTAYLSSFRKGGKGDKDIYKLGVYGEVGNVALLNGEIIHAQNKEIPEESYIELTCLNCVPEHTSTITPRVRDGVFLSKLEKCKDYRLTYYYNKLTVNPYSELFSTNCDLAYQEIYKPVLLDEENQKIIPFFDYLLNGTIADRKSGEAIPNALIEFTNNDGEIIETLTTDSMGQFVSSLVENKSFGHELNYIINVNAEGYLLATFELNSKLSMDSVMTLSYTLDKKDFGTDLGPFMVYYNFDKHDINDDAKVELDKIVKIMNENPEVNIELGSHTDCVGSSVYNMWLSKKRAKSAAKYIAGRITNTERISSQGYGETRPTNDCKCWNCSNDDHRANRRTEFVIVPQ